MSLYKALLILLGSLLFLSACANSDPRLGNDAYGSPRHSAVYGVVQSIEVMPSDHEQESRIGLGSVIGGVVGGLLGNQVGGGRGKTAATVAGVAGGAVIGHEVEKRRTNGNSHTYLIRLRLDDGVYRNVSQNHIGDLRVGDRVRLEDDRVLRENSN